MLEYYVHITSYAIAVNFNLLREHLVCSHCCYIIRSRCQNMWLLKVYIMLYKLKILIIASDRNNNTVVHETYFLVLVFVD